MSQAGLAEMARPKGRPRAATVRQDVSTKFDRALLGMARTVATAKGMSVAQYLSEAARPVIQRDYGFEMKRLLDEKS